MQLIINGETKEFSENMSLKQIMQSLKIEEKVMAAAVNMEIIKKDDWDRFTPNDKDKLELLQFVGGG
ncbi:thiamine biosynthesis protein ThiS [Malaciobacter molluscorum LMG 25693]|uniref:Thiamine biosynthesis protein n=1 Tax=Malaciobacter molluscorum LMG 25693 TaxID=870501 RepID=A0A2G1DH29_9BACT|nr:sulfur carrier protein ThiS [Malaciobacter molluscorum]AXX93384.1 thiamine biosynthesis protein [Malaciobacter molluscorum LMG 25693]PHO17787.1 thiamine biosynthesis protein ThiS [Malaciobacter molluscorum LMG 25693]RXJ95097.1 thiamine biosynthesis protein ThiS [Malaciobacter molluscorum]